jgi:hypothetical protein
MITAQRTLQQLPQNMATVIIQTWTQINSTPRTLNKDWLLYTHIASFCCFFYPNIFELPHPTILTILLALPYSKEYSRVNRINIIGSIDFNPFSYSGFKISSLHRRGRVTFNCTAAQNNTHFKRKQWQTPNQVTYRRRLGIHIIYLVFTMKSLQIFSWK